MDVIFTEEAVSVSSEGDGVFLNRGEYVEHEASVVQMLDALRPSLLPDEIQHTEHMLSVGELELAFESLGLSVMRARPPLTPSQRTILLQVGQTLGLDRESVYDPDFWQNFVAWLDQQGGASLPLP